MRTFSPCAKVLIDCTGVAKSTTSKRLRKLSGRTVLTNSTTIFFPCWRMSIPVVVSASSTTIRPSPARPRRKSTSRIAWPLSVRLSAKCATAAPPGVIGREESVTISVLPSMTASCATERRRLRTIRVLSAPCTTFMLRNSPSPMSCELLPRLLVVPAKSNAIRAGLATVKLGGIVFKGSLVCTRSVILPPC